MQLAMSTDEAALCRVVGPDTFARGRDYARRGAVITAQWRPEDEHIFGQVRGTARTPYTAVAVVARARDGALTSFRGSCTCPVGANCKHTVALVLAGAPDVDAAADDVAYAVGNAPWERSLADLVAATTQETPTEAAVALQFELVRPAATATRWTRPGGPRLDVRPVVPGKNGGWVRTGISWSTLGYQSYRHPQIAAEQLRLLSEAVPARAASAVRDRAGSCGSPGSPNRSTARCRRLSHRASATADHCGYRRVTRTGSSPATTPRCGSGCGWSPSMTR